jgi:hypothetical protein
MLRDKVTKKIVTNKTGYQDITKNSIYICILKIDLNI